MEKYLEYLNKTEEEKEEEEEAKKEQSKKWWICQRCEYENELNVNRCRLCGLSK